MRETGSRTLGAWESEIAMGTNESYVTHTTLLRVSESKRQTSDLPTPSKETSANASFTAYVRLQGTALASQENEAASPTEM